MLKVLVPSDGSASSQCAVRHVISECSKHRELDIHLLNVQPPFSKFISDHSSDEGRMEFHQEQARQALAPARQLLDSAGIAYTVHCEVGDRVDCIVETARRLQCDAIVMGTARKSSLVRLVENSVTNQVLERTNVPVEVIAGEAASRLERVGIPAGVGTGAGLLALWMAAN